MANQVQQRRSVGFHVSPEINIIFIESDRDKVKAIIPDVEDPVPVKLPEVSPPTSSVDFSITSKVTRLLRNCHLQPSYSVQKGQKTGAVSFIPIDPENKTWEKCKEIELQDKDSPCFFRSDGTLCYAFVNTVTMWDWKNHNFTTTSFKTGYITALAELPDGRLIIGDDKGNLLLQGDPQPLLPDKKDSIQAIVAITSTCYLIKFKNKSAVVLNTQNRKVLQELVSCPSFFVLKKNVFGFLKNEKLILFQINENKCKEMEHSFKDKNISEVQAVSDNTLLLVPITEESEESIIVWNFEKNSSKEHKNDFLQEKAQQKKLIFIDEGTFACPGDRGTAIVFYSVEKKEFISAEAAGTWGVSTLIPLSDGSIMYATHKSPSGIHVVTKNRKVTFTDTDLPQNRPVESMRELEDGSVAIRFPKAMVIVSPKVKQAESVAYKIEKCLLELRHNPSQLNLYEKLAQFYEENPDKRYQTYLAGLESAIKGSQLYLARRYYEKARKIKPDTEEPSCLFMSYLENSVHSKQKTQVALDLHRVRSKSNPSAKLLLNPNKKCRERLFVGEGDFSFTKALIEKHQKTHSNLAKSLTATELGYLVDNSEEKEPDDNTPKRILGLQEKDVKVLFGINGQYLHQTFKGKRFKRIHWNCPFGNSDDASRRAFKDVIPQFFLSCSYLQLNKDRIHISLMQEKDKNDYWKKRQKENPIVEGATLAGYRLIRKREFGVSRYPKYVHVKTGSNEKYTLKGEMREFVFEKADMPVYSKEADLQKRAQELRNSTEKEYEVKTDKEKPDNKDYYFECSTDEDSSDYYESDTEPVTP